MLGEQIYGEIIDRLRLFPGLREALGAVQSPADELFGDYDRYAYCSAPTAFGVT